MDFYFHGRHKRPPLDHVNALLSFAYTLLPNYMNQHWKPSAGC
ncbi:CRISPR-associated endonuclease Cas1 [Paenibacillus sp. S25]|nr:CRISPR-associated endonuclease Cas1 [Paenibacillus sp. S25]